MAETLREQQAGFAGHLRDPSRQAPPPGIEARRMQVYRELFYGSLEGLLAGSFPVLRAALGDARWHERVRAFYAGHRSQTPLFTGIAEVFSGWLQDQTEDPQAPWVAELAHYEWVESHLYLSDARDPSHDPHGDLLEGVPLLSCLAMPLGYRWPVDRISVDYRPVEMPDVPTLLLVYRDTTHQVRFARLAPLAYRLLVSLCTRQCRGREHLLDVGGDVGEGLALLEALRGQGVVKGVLHPA